MNTKFFYCSGSLRFVSIEKACDGKADCVGGEDELVCVSKLQTNGTFPGMCSRAVINSDLFFDVIFCLTRYVWVTVCNISLSL